MEVLAAVILAMTVLILNVHSRDIDTPVPVWVSSVILRTSNRMKVLPKNAEALNPWIEVTSKLDRIAFCLTFGFVIITSTVFNFLITL